MLRATLLLVVLGGSAVSDEEAGNPLRDLVERLRSDRIDEREAAGRKLVDAGPAALVELRRAARDADPEVAQHAALLIRRITAARLLGPAVFRRLPEAETLLAGSRDHDWTRVFKTSAELPGIRRASLDALAPRALAGALQALETPDDPGGFLRRAWGQKNNEDPIAELRTVVARAADWDLRSAVPILQAWLRNADPDVRECAVLALGHLDIPGIAPDVFRLLRDEHRGCRSAAALVLGLRGYPDAIPALVCALADSETEVWSSALVALEQLDPRAAGDEIERGLARDPCPGRGTLIFALERLRLGKALQRSRLFPDDMADTDLATARILIDRQRPDAVARIVPLLKDARPGVRGAAVTILQDLNAREAVESIRPLLRDPVPDNQYYALVALAELGGPSLLEDILPIARGGDPQLQHAAIGALGKFGDPRALPDLRRLLEESEEGVRKASVAAMKTLGSPDAAPALLRALEDPEEGVREAATLALLKLSPACAFRRIARMISEGFEWSLEREHVDPDQRPFVLSETRLLLAESDPVLRKAALVFARRLGLKDLLPDLLPLAQDPDPEFRCDALETLAALHRRASLGSLLPRIEDDSAKIRAMAATRAFDLGSRDEVLPFLNRAMAKNGNDEALVSLLARIRTRQDVPRFVEALRHDNRDVRVTALESLAALRAGASVPAILPLLEDPEDGVRRDAAVALGTLAAPEAIPSLRKALLDPDPEVQVAVLNALAELRATDALPDLERLLDHDDPALRRTAAEVLGRLGAQTAIPRLREMLQDPDYCARQDAARALGRLEAREALPELLGLLRRSEAAGAVPDGVLDALGDLRAREALPDLLRLLLRQVKAEDDPRAVVKALKRLDPAAAGARLIEYLERGDFTPHYGNAALLRLRGRHRERWDRCHDETPPSPPHGAIRGLVDLGCRDALPTLRRLAWKAEAAVRAEAIQALAALSSRDSAVELIPFLSLDLDANTAAVLVQRLGTLGRRDALPALQRCLRHPNWLVRSSAITACARIGGSEILPELRPLLDDPVPWVGSEAAAALCRNGDRSGLSMLIESGEQLESLNSLRAPSAWRRLATQPLPGALRGDLQEVLTKLSREAGLSLELPDDFSPQEKDRSFSPDRYPSIMDLLLSLDETFILEEKRLRIVRRGEAWAFWESWAAARK